jgi:nitrite reductase/ring-hydroxylating ferredoxin subunit
VGDRAVLDVDGEEIVVFRSGGGVYALANACPHEGNPLVEGELLGPTLECAYHGWRFDLGSGACLLGDEPARSFPVEERDGEIWIALE